IDSIFAIINNVALDTEKSEQEIKDALKVLVTDAPTNNYTQLGADDFANYGKAVINELNSTMAIKIKDNQNDPYTLGAIMDELGLNGEVNTDKIMDMIDSAKLEEIINASTIDRAFITDASSSVDMVAALIREVIGDFLTGEVADLISADSILGINVDQEADKTYLTIVVDVEIADMLGDDADEMMNFMLDLLPSQTVLTVKVDVTEGVGTYADTEIKYNFSEDSDKVMDLIEDFGVDLPTDDVATSVRDAISDFTGNDMLGVTLVDGGIEMDTVFKVINNVAFKSDLTDFEIKNVMKSVYASSDAKIDTYFADNGITIVQPSSDYTSFLGQIKSKYFIRSTLTSFDDVFDVVAAGGNTINNTNFDLDALKHTPLTIEELKPTMAYSEIGALMNEKLGGDLVVSSLNFKQVGENKYLQVYAKINLADYMGGENSFTDIISVSQLVVGIQINISNVLTDASGKYYETTCTINDMSDVDMTNLILMLKEISPDFENEIFVAVEDAGRQAYNAFSSFDENLGGNYSFTVDGLKIGDVFSFIGREMLGETTDYDAQALKVKKALQGMFASTTGSSSFNYTESNFIFNTPEAVAPELSFSLFQNGITDRQLGAYAEAKINEGGEEVGHVVQLNIISSSRTTSKTTSDVAYVNSFKSNTIGNGTYIIITDKIKLSNIVEVDDKFADLLPEEVYMTFVLKYDEANVKFDIVSYYRVNEMDAEAEETMLELIGLSMTEMDNVMMDNAGKCIKPINDLFDVVESMVPVSGITLVHNFAEITDTATTARGKFFVSF
ncbi:MAG: hypothetical protein J6R35_01120, partial [Clostridia bacterium]|nr:hypothetical protein [Clostridia bacterium]